MQAENECDMNTDTCFLVKNFIVLNSTIRAVLVYAYNKSYAPLEDTQVITGDKAYDNEVMENTYILISIRRYTMN